ncbi:MAG: hypothetical protein R3E01_34700 [Pirellulaceae bacterium]|nr:hypothetical protein [Planctomycetales bacterium]
MAKGLTITAMIIAVLILVLFAMDLIISFPFQKAKPMMDIAFVVCALGLGYISWLTLKEVR